MESDVVGINLSNYISGGDELSTIRGMNILRMVEYILQETDYNILLIPHVFWVGQDDRIICKVVYDMFRDTNRVFLCESEKLNYCEIRYIISKCRYFVGARTHSVISAYSMQVPALALGYSVKSIGIAKAVGLPKELVVDSNHLKSNNEFTKGFKYMEENEAVIKRIYKGMPEYIEKAYGAREIIKRVYEHRL